MTVEHTTPLSVRWGDVDAAGIVFYPRFFEWYDLGCGRCSPRSACRGRAVPRHGIVGVPSWVGFALRLPGPPATLASGRSWRG
jgi:hypothetical protein